jgi:hypothetical protein
MANNSKTNNRRITATNNVDDIVFRSVSTIVERQDTWIGTMTELSSAINRVASKRQRTILPGSPGALRIVINRVVNRLRNRGISVRFVRTSDHGRTRLVRFMW